VLFLAYKHILSMDRCSARYSDGTALAVRMREALAVRQSP